MSKDLAPIWSQVGWYLDNGINIIPVRDEDEYHGERLFAKKTPFSQWKKYQSEKITPEELFKLMNNYNTTAIAMVCGSISGNLIIIDVDVKYYPGIDVILLNSIKEFYPDLLNILRVHKTPSGGLHLLYRIDINNNPCPTSIHLAEREATEEEKAANIKNKSKTRCFIELKGEGGLSTAPPALGYSVRRDAPIPIISFEEHMSLIGLCKNLNEYYPDPTPYKPPKSEREYYDENPFEHYNRTVDPKELLEKHGWSFVRKTNNYIWFTRPGGRRNDVHASYIIDKGIFKIFSPNTGLEERGYNPSSILAHYEFNNDKSETYHHLVNIGYGRIKPHIETRIAKTKALRDEPMPTNASDEGLRLYEDHKQKLKQDHPHGIFWEPNDRQEIIISRLRFNAVALALGFRLFNGDPVQIKDIFIYKSDERIFFDRMREYVHEEDPDLYEDIYNSLQAFLQKNGRFELSQLDQLDQNKILKDDRNTCYKCYTNGYVQITKDYINLNNYYLVQDKLIWYEKVQQRDFINRSGVTGLYSDFLRLACDLDSNKDHIMKVIGFLAHDYKDSTTAYVTVLSEKCADPKDGGGTGKNLFCQLFENTTTYSGRPADKNIDHKNLLQAWRGEKVYALSDAPKDFNWDLLKEPAGGNAIDKKLFKDEKTMKPEDVPKFIVQTQFSPDISDGGLRRRTIVIEFTNFFTVSGGVDIHYKKHFTKDWEENDWIDYDNFICNSIQVWLSGGLKLKPFELSVTGWEKQFVQTFGQNTFDFINEYWHEWNGFVSNNTFRQQFDDFFNELGITQFNKYRPTLNKVHKAIEEYCKKYNCQIIIDAQRKINGINEKGKSFSKEDAPF